jgi:hypothetical protein
VITLLQAFKSRKAIHAKRAAVLVALAVAAYCTAKADTVLYTPGTIATFGAAGKFNSTIYLTVASGYDLVATSTGVCVTAPCQPDVVQVYTRTGYHVADIALKPNDPWSSITLMLPAGAYQIHLTGSGALTQLMISTKVSK